MLWSFRYYEKNMKYSESLKKNDDFRRVYRQGKSQANRLLVMYVAENNLGINRIGISVSKKVGNSVVRHRIRRLIKEAVRLSEEQFHIGYDCVFVARTNAKDCTYFEIERAICRLFTMHGLKKEEENEVHTD